MAEQLTFDLPAKAALGRDDFFVAPSNAVAVQALEAWQSWPQRRAVLTGDKGAGKTHLAHVWAGEVGAAICSATDLDIETLDPDRSLVIEDIHGIASHADHEEALFHVLNLFNSREGAVLLTSTQSPSRVGFELPDLASRVQAMPVFSLDAPDDALLSVLLIKLFADRQISVAPGLIGYITPRMNRSFDDVHRLVEALDQQALSVKRPITRGLAGRVLDNLRSSDA